MMKKRRKSNWNQRSEIQIPRPIKLPDEYNDYWSYLVSYIESYRNTFHQTFIEPPPKGAGYPKLAISPYLYEHEIFCYLAKDGAVVAVYTGRTDEELNFLPKHKWMVDTQTLSTIDRGEGHKPTKIKLKIYDLSLEELVNRLTPGLFSEMFKNTEYLKNMKLSFWNPIIARHLTQATDNDELIRFYSYLEILLHTDKPAWDQRNVGMRVLSDIRRDFAYVMARRGKTYGSIKFGISTEELFYERLNELKRAIDGFEELLDSNSEADESLFHNFLKDNSILLDVYAEEIISKPRLPLPEGESLQNKTYVEPDFIIKRPGDEYILIELEKPGKTITTQKGHTSQDLNQSVFQTAEWEYYLKNHHSLIADRFPNIQNRHTYMVVISRRKQFEERFVGRNLKQYNSVAERFSLLFLDTPEMLVEP
jgi:hypothetical protein